MSEANVRRSSHGVPDSLGRIRLGEHSQTGGNGRVSPIVAADFLAGPMEFVDGRTHVRYDPGESGFKIDETLNIAIQIAAATGGSARSRHRVGRGD